MSEKAIENNDIELISKILGKGKVTSKSYKNSQQIVQYFKEPCAEKLNYSRLATTNSKELKKIDGIGKATAQFMEAVLQFSRRMQSYSREDFPTINSPDDVANLLLSEMRYYKKEVFKVLLLDTKNRLIKVDTISSGILDASLVHPREAFYLAIQETASSIILVHNHPSGNISPSSQDIEITKNIVAAGKILSIDVVDHIIIGDGKFLSMKEKHFI